MKLYIFLYFCISVLIVFGEGVSARDRIRLEDVKSLTLNSGRKTYAKRSAAIPQLRCVGGSAGCDSRYLPQVVQCKNQGSDGMQIQWDCQADLEPAVKFGRVEVSCEGYSHPGDSHVLAGSCGLEYTLELTAKGQRQKQKKRSWFSSGRSRSSESSGSSNFIFLVVICIVGFVIYKTCIQSNRETDDSYHPPQGHHPSAPTRDPPPYPGESPPPYSQGAYGYGQSPPPPGFKSEYTETRHRPHPDTSTNRVYPDLNQETQTNQNQQGGGFWTGAALGGLAGYLFGNSGSNRGYGGSYTHHDSYHGNRGDSWFGSSSWCDSGHSRNSSRDSRSSDEGNSRTAHGYGGTSVR